MNDVQKYLDELLEKSKQYRYGLWCYNNIIKLLQVENFVLFKDDLREFISKQKTIFNEIDTKYFNKKIIHIRNKRRTDRKGKDEFSKEMTSNKKNELNRLGKIIGFLESVWLPYVETKQKSLGYIVSLQADFHKPSDDTINFNNENVDSENENNENDLGFYKQRHEKELLLYKRKRGVYSKWFYQWYEKKISENHNLEPENQKKNYSVMICALKDFDLFDQNKEGKKQADSANKSYNRWKYPKPKTKKVYPSIEKNLPKVRIKQN